MCLLLVVGNKNDDPASKVVLTEDAKRFADQIGIELFETSAKENINVEEVSFAWSLVVVYFKLIIILYDSHLLHLQKTCNNMLPKYFYVFCLGLRDI